jgi:hypothetical protein
MSELPGPIRHGEAKHFLKTFIHPVTLKPIEFSPDDSPEKKLRLITDVHGIHSDFHLAMFTTLFPESLPPKSFNKESVGHPEEVELSKGEREIRRVLIRKLGWESVRKKQPDEQDVPEIHLGYTHEAGAIVTMLNNLPDVDRMKGIAQTEPRSNLIDQTKREGLRVPKRTLHNHVNHCGYGAAKTNIRLAMHNPDLYLERVQRDMAEFEFQYEQMQKDEDPNSIARRSFAIKPSKETYALVDSLLQANVIPPEKQNNPKYRQAIAVAYEYQKYMSVFAVLHDVESPGWKDVFMKTKARVPGQKPADTSEDTELMRIFDMYYLQYQLGDIRKAHGLDADLLRTMVVQLASEDSPTLSGYLLKDKRKHFTERSEYDFIPKGQGFDEDQRSGTDTNASDIVNWFLPGGFRHIPREEIHPLGSFEERMRLLAYAAATGLSKEVLEKTLKDVGIDPSLVYIASEEMAVGANLVLREYKGTHKDGTEGSEILPVAVVPGDVKRVSMMFNFLHMYFYVGEKRITMETATQDAIAYGLGNGKIRQSTFTNRTDLEAAKQLNKITPALPWFHADPELNANARVLSEREASLIVQKDGSIPHMLMIKVDTYPEVIFEKSGTLVEDDQGTILPYLDVIQQKREARRAGDVTIHPESLRARFANVRKALEKGPWYYAIPVNPAQQVELQSLLGGVQDPMVEMLKLWTEPLEIDGKTVRFPLRDELFPSIR